LLELAGKDPNGVTRLTLMTELLGFSVALLRTTLRIEQLNGRYYRDLKARRVPILFALWHGRMFLPIDAHRNESIVTMASQSKDGNIIARWLESNGYLVTRGSTTRGGSEALTRRRAHRGRPARTGSSRATRGRAAGADDSSMDSAD